jgi:anti-sigma B factor antagonist
MWLALHAGRIGPVGVIYLRGELDLATQPRLEGGLGDLLDTGCTRIVVSLDGIEFVDLSGLGLLARTHLMLRSAGGWLRLAAPPHGVRRLLALTDLRDSLPVYPDVYAAITDAERVHIAPPTARDHEDLPD